MPNSAEAMNFAMQHNRRSRQAVPSIMKKVPAVYIFSVCPEGFFDPMVYTGIGSFRLPIFNPDDPKQAKRGYSEPLSVPGVFAEEYDLFDGKMGLNLWEALPNPDDRTQPGFVLDIIGMGSSNPGLSAGTTNKEWFGVFYSTSETPSAKEVSDAKAKLTKMMTLLLNDADRLALQGEKGLNQISGTHRMAAKYLNQKRSWASLPEAMNTCPGCGEPIKPGVVAHMGNGGCGAILNMEKAIELGMVQPPQAPEQREAKSK